MIIYNSKDLFFKKPFGCVTLGNSMQINVLTEKAEDFPISLVIEKDGGSKTEVVMEKSRMTGSFFVYSCEYKLEETGLYFYNFVCSGNEIFKDEKGKTSFSGEKWQVSCVEEIYDKNPDFCGKIMYQIFPDRFNKSGICSLSDKMTPFYVHENMEDCPHYKPDESGKILNNDFFGGNLKGIEKSLPYLMDLGVEVIYLNPIFMAYSNHRYDTADYMKIDPMLGTEEDFADLCESAHNLGIKIILDGVFSHTGDDSVYFDKYNRFKSGGAYQDINSKYKSWYSFKRFPDEYDSWWGISTLPCVNELQSSFSEFITGKDGVIRYWLGLGADGFRLDVADELPDLFIERIKSASNAEKKNSCVIGEVWEDASNKISYSIRRKYILGKELDGVMNYVYKNAIIDFVKNKDAERFIKVVTDVAENYPLPFLLSSMVMLSTHDTDRILTCLGVNAECELSKDEKAYYKLGESELKEAKKRLSVAVFLLFTLPGNSCIYYGDEAGMQGFCDPFNRKYFGLKTEDEEIFSLYKRLSEVKRTNKALRCGGLGEVFSKGGFVIFKRQTEDDGVCCAVNRGDHAEEINYEIKELIYATNSVKNNNRITVLPYGCVVFR